MAELDTEPRALDANDPLRRFREEFFFPRGEIYLCGHSLGLQPRRCGDYIEEELDQWREFAVKAHLEGRRPWLPYHRFLTRPMAALVGAQEREVVMMNSLTTNLHLLMVSFYRPTRQRHKILVERKTFPSDRYAVESQIRFHGLDPGRSLIEAAPRDGEETLRIEDLASLIERNKESLALVLFPGIQYFTGQAFEIQEITRLAHRAGAIAGFDLAHAAGNLPLQMHDWNADFAVWCTYKYLNSGPGSVGGAFVHSRHEHSDLPRLAGWWGHDEASRFAMGPDFRVMPGAEGWQLSNPPILSMAAIRASLDVFSEAGGIQPLRAKSEKLTAYMESLLRKSLASDVEILTPSDPSRRGCQLSIRLRRDTTTAHFIFEQLEQGGITCDWREPNVIRASAVPLYNSFHDVHRFVEVLSKLLRA